jgi:hypothetical protein
MKLDSRRVVVGVLLPSINRYRLGGSGAARHSKGAHGSDIKTPNITQEASAGHQCVDVFPGVKIPL